MYHSDTKYLTAQDTDVALIFDTSFLIGPSKIWTTGSIRKYGFQGKPFAALVTIETELNGNTNGSILANQSFATPEEAKAFIATYNTPIKREF